MKEFSHNLAKNLQEKLIAWAVKIYGGEKFIIPDVDGIKSPVALSLKISLDQQVIDVIDTSDQNRVVATIPIEQNSISIKSELAKNSIVEIILTPSLIEVLKAEGEMNYLRISQEFRHSIRMSPIIQSLKVKRY